MSVAPAPAAAASRATSTSAPGQTTDYTEVQKGRPRILQELREGTAGAHLAMESLVTLMGPNVDAAEVGKYLIGNLRFIRPMERALASQAEALAELGISLPERSKVAALEQDLRFLGMSQAEIDAIADFPRLPNVSNPAEALGVLYVLEGSTLGGAQITRHLEKSLPPEDHGCLTFLRSYGRDIGAKWKEFSAAIGAFPYNDVPGAAQETKDAASATFILMAQSLKYVA